METLVRDQLERWLRDENLRPDLRQTLAALEHELWRVERERQRLAEELVQERSAKQAAQAADARDRDWLLDMFFAQSLDGFYIMAMDEPVRWEPLAPDEGVLERAYHNQRVTHVNPAMAAQYGARPADL